MKWFKEPPESCPKCGFAGLYTMEWRSLPLYVYGFLDEWLEYACNNCGWEFRTPTADSNGMA